MAKKMAMGLLHLEFTYIRLMRIQNFLLRLYPHFMVLKHNCRHNKSRSNARVIVDYVLWSFNGNIGSWLVSYVTSWENCYTCNSFSFTKIQYLSWGGGGLNENYELNNFHFELSGICPNISCIKNALKGSAFAMFPLLHFYLNVFFYIHWL